MLRSFDISGFRTFQHLRVPRLGRVNLIVGRNNAGKTMFLEALRLYSLGGSARAIRDVLLDRDEVSAETEVADDDGRDFQLQVSALFHHLSEPADHSYQDFRIHLGEVDRPTRNVSITLRIIRRAQTENSSPIYQYEVVDPFEVPSDAILDRGIEVALGDRKRVIPLHLIRKSTEFSQRDDRFEPAFVPSRGVQERELARWWDMATLRNGEHRVLECLRLITPAESVTFVEHPGRYYRGDRIAFVRLSADVSPVPLKSLGDGVSRLLQIGLAVERARAGRGDGLYARPNLYTEPTQPYLPQTPLLLIDEIENGIHYTVHAQLWKAVIRLAELHNIQVFATTHSWDCICGLRDAVAELPTADAMLVRLEKKDGANKAVVFDQRELDVITRDEIEVR